MYNPILIKTDYSLLSSLIKVKDLTTIHSPAIGIIDDNLSYVMEFYDLCLNNNIKPIIGLDILFDTCHIYLYAKNYDGYLELIKLNNLKRAITLNDLKINSSNLVLVIPYSNIHLYDELSSLFNDTFISYKTESEKANALIKTNKTVYANLTLCLKEEDKEYLKYLTAIKKGVLLNELEDAFDTSYLINSDKLTAEDINTTLEFANLFDFKLEFNKRYIPELEDSEKKIISLIKKGLNKRLNNKVPTVYLDRIKYEFSVIKEMGFIDYFLIVYDYVLYAKKNNILVGPGRGSGAGSLVSYVLGITDIDPIKYNLLFERFLNKERITMPDIDLDFEETRREEVIDYIRNKYGTNHVSLIMTYGTLGSKQVIRDVGKVLDIPVEKIDSLAKYINPRFSLKDNINSDLSKFLNINPDLKKVYHDSMKLEGLKRHISTHAAGVVICSVPLAEVIPLSYSDDITLTGFTMEYLERLGLLKMDILALKNLSVITNVRRLIKENLKEDLILSEIPLNDPKTLKLFYDVDTIGIFQFESKGMMNFLRKLKVASFEDLINAVALFRPGPMENIDSFIKRRDGKEKTEYLDPSLEPILKNTYGIIVYQEQVIEILNKMASYTYAEADIVRRAMSKKKKDVLENEKEHFINNAVKNGYKKETAIKVFDYILKFANYGFNKAHSVCYAYVGYIMGYLKSNYRVSFISNLLNMSLGSEVKTKEYIDEAKKFDIKVMKPDINTSDLTYKIVNFNILMPLSAIKNIGNVSNKAVIDERTKNGEFKDFFDFVSRCYNKNLNRKIMVSLINAGVFNTMNISTQTLINNLDSAIDYASLINDLDSSLVLKPIIKTFEEYSRDILMANELEAFGFYISNHPVAKYSDVVKSNNLINNFDKTVKVAILVEAISKIKTKKNEDMAFIDGSDDYGNISFVIFPKYFSLIADIKKGDLVLITGKVIKRFDKYQIQISNLNKIV